ncbi:MAG: hypothetical protein JRZ94_06050 [Nitrososphaerota archaeon]|nr:hypothetical protein [Nitrososphaerota archaeon]
MDKTQARISVVVEKELVEKLRTIQAEMISQSKDNVSFSFVVSQILRGGLESKT